MKIFAMLLSMTLLFGCATGIQEVPTEQLDESPDILQFSGEIVNIKEAQKKAAFSERMGGSFIGALVGGQIGGGSTREILGSTGAFIGYDLANEAFGDVIDHVFIETEDGTQYDCYVKNHVFKLGDKVVFTVVADHVSAIILQDESQP